MAAIDFASLLDASRFSRPQAESLKALAEATLAVAGLTWNIVTSADAGTAASNNGYLMNTGGSLRTVTLPASAAAGFFVIVAAKGAQVRILANGNTIDRVTAGNDLLLADGDTAVLLAYATGALRVI